MFGVAADPVTLNRYAYAQDSPALNTDPGGRCGPFCGAAGVVACVFDPVCAAVVGFAGVTAFTIVEVHQYLQQHPLDAPQQGASAADAGSPAGPSMTPGPSSPRIPLSAKHRNHILNGDSTGGGHGPGRGISGKSEFPGTLTDSDIATGVQDIANDPANYPGGAIPTSGRVKITGYINGVKTEVVVEPGGEGVITAWPEGVPRNP